MVTVAQATRIAQQSRQKVAEQRKIITGVRQRLEQARARRLTRAELQRRTRADLLKRKQQVKQFEQLKQSQLSQLKPFEQQVTTAEEKVLRLETQIRNIKDKERQFERGRKLAGVTGGVLGLETDVEKQGFDFGRQQLSVAEQRKKFFEFKTELAKAGLTPLFENGKLTGFSDEIRMLSFDVKELEGIGETRLRQLEKVGLIEIAKIEIPEIDAQVTKSKISRFLTGDIGKQFIGVGIPGIVGFPVAPLGQPMITAEEIKIELRKHGLSAKVLAEFIPETPAEVAVVAAIGAIAGAGIPIVSKLTIRGVQLLGTLTALDTDAAPETRIAGTLLAVAPLIPFLTKQIAKLDPSTKPSGRLRTAFSLLEALYKKEGKKKSPLDLGRISQELSFKLEGKVLRETTLSERVSIIRKIFEKIKKTEDPQLQKEQTKGLIKFLEASWGKEKTNIVLKEYLTQEGFSFLPKQSLGSGLQQFISRKVAAVIPPVIKVEPKIKPPKLAPPKVKLKEPPKSLFFVETKQQARQRQIPGQLFFTKTPQEIKTTQRQLLRAKLKQRQKQQQKQLLLFKAATKQIQALKLKEPKIIPAIKPFPKVIKPLKKFRLPKGVTSTPTTKALRMLGKGGVNILVGQKPSKQKIIGKNMAAFRALKKGLKFIDNTLDASFQLLPTGKKAKRIDIKPFNIGSRFRASKRDPKIIVEKKAFRLSSPKERKDIQFFRKTSNSNNLFNSKPRKRKTKRRKKK